MSINITENKLLLQTSERQFRTEMETAKFCSEPAQFFTLSTALALRETLGLSLDLGRTTVNSPS